MISPFHCRHFLGKMGISIENRTILYIKQCSLPVFGRFRDLLHLRYDRQKHYLTIKIVSI
jgi:hypothetical protein